MVLRKPVSVLLALLMLLTALPMAMAEYSAVDPNPDVAPRSL